MQIAPETIYLVLLHASQAYHCIFYRILSKYRHFYQIEAASICILFVEAKVVLVWWAYSVFGGKERCVLICCIPR